MVYRITVVNATSSEAYCGKAARKWYLSENFLMTIDGMVVQYVSQVFYSFALFTYKFSVIG